MLFGLFLKDTEIKEIKKQAATHAKDETTIQKQLSGKVFM